MIDKEIDDTAWAKQAGGKASRKTIAFLTSNFATGTTPSVQWSGVIAGAEEHDVNLIGIVGGNIKEAQSNIVYELATPGICSGIVTWAITRGLSDQEQEAVNARFKPLPIVTVLSKISGYPVVTTDDYTGMQEAVAHLIETHGCRRLAFIRAPENHYLAKERYRAYRMTLEHYKIPFDQTLVTPAWNWAKKNGERAVTLFLDERGLNPGRDLDAIVAASDLMAIGALEALHKRGIRVPEDLALAGFNNSEDAQYTIPSITSVASPLRTHSQEAVGVLKDLMEQAPVSEQVSLPTYLVVHQSCGCLDDMVAHAAVFAPPDAQKNMPSATFNVQRKEVLQDILQAMSIPDGSEKVVWAEKLLDAFITDLDAPGSGVFLSVLRQTLKDEALADKKVLVWQYALSAIQRHVGLNQGSCHAILLLGQGRMMVDRITAQYLSQQQLRAEEDAVRLRALNQKLLTSFDINQLTHILSEGMHTLGIPGCYLALYEDPQPYAYPQPAPQWSRLILAYDKDRQFPLETGGTRFPTQQILPEGMWPENRRYSFILQALYFQDLQIGFVLFEVGPKNWPLYDTLRAQISNSLQGALLFEQAREHAAQLDGIVTNTMTITEEMQGTISETARQAQAVSDAAQASMHVSLTGQDVVTKAITGMETIRQYVEDISRSILMLAEHTQKIEEIIVTLEDISERSKILAINASIEAARAGTKGNAFAIVAREMRSLAEKSREAIINISKILNEIQHSANTAVMVSKEGSKGAKHSMEMSKHAGETIHDLTMTINEAAQMAIQIAASTQQQTNAMQQLIVAMISVKEASAQTSTSFKELG